MRIISDCVSQTLCSPSTEHLSCHPKSLCKKRSVRLCGESNKHEQIKNIAGQVLTYNSKNFH